MPSNLDFDPELLAEAQKLSGLRYKKDVINEVLREYVARHKQVEIIKLFHTISYDAGYNYKEGRRNR